jgi:hypothetical protein
MRRRRAPRTTLRHRTAQSSSRLLCERARAIEAIALYARRDAFLCALPKANAAARSISRVYTANFYFQFYFAKSRP